MALQLQFRTYSRTSAVLLMVLICAGFAGNYAAPRLFAGFSYLFGSIPVLLVLRLFGFRWGLLAGAISAAATWFLFGHPYAMLWLFAEPLFVGWMLVNGKTRNIILYDALYWPLLGAPLLWIVFRHLMQVSPAGALTAMLIYWVIGITNALVASLLLTYAPRLPIFDADELPRSIPIHQLIFNVLMAAVLVPAVAVVVIYGKDAERRYLDRLHGDLAGSSQAAIYEIRLKLQQSAAETSGFNADQRDLAAPGVRRDALREILLSARRKPFTRLTLADGSGRVVCSTDAALAAQDLFDPCRDGVRSSINVGNVSKCTSNAATVQPYWRQYQHASFILDSALERGTPWKIVADTPLDPYLRLLFHDYGRALLIVLCLNIFTLAISLYTSRRLAAPLLELSRVTTDLPDRLFRGKATAWPESMVAEIDQLSDNFRAMATALGYKFQEITYYNENLEARVRERTKDLTRTNAELQKEIMERKLTERQRDHLMEELVNQLNFLQTMIDAIPNPLFYRDLNGRYQGCNRVFEENWGLAREEIVGKTDQDLFPPRLADAFRASDQMLIIRRGVRVYETQLRFADGLNHDVVIYKATYDDAKGNLAGVVGNIVDISLRTRAEAERDRLMVELQQKNKELEGIVYVASHDLRSPLVNIQGFSRKLGKSCADLDGLLTSAAAGSVDRRQLERILREAIPKSLAFITGSVEKMDGLLKGLLRLSRLGRSALCFETLDMRRIMEKIVSSMAFQIDTVGARIELGELGPCLADAGQVIQVFSNLLDNALKYHSKERPLVVRIFSEEFDQGIRYCVEDNGIGIPRDQQEAIWEIFHRLNPDDRQGEGLGLTLTRRIVARLGGSIWVEPAAVAGSCFYVVLPKPLAAE